MLEHALFGDHAPFKHASRPPVKHASGAVGHNLEMTLGERIRARAEKLGITAKQIAATCGIEDKAVYQWYNGTTKGLRPENLVRTARLLRTTVEWLVFEDGPEDTPISSAILPDDAKEAAAVFMDLPPPYRAAMLKAMRELAHATKWNPREGDRRSGNS
jgi:transcriptional regulator with XRE-family HTH domain